VAEEPAGWIHRRSTEDPDEECAGDFLEAESRTARVFVCGHPEQGEEECGVEGASGWDHDVYRGEIFVQTITHEGTLSLQVNA